MIDLPRDLAPWRALLDLFAPDLAEGIGGLLPRLALAIGPMRASRPAGDGEPDGFAGLGRRGSYERLLLTEWLLADELPDEFLRRAVSGEHAFFQLARRTPSSARASVALFDAGPDQLGAPRVAHLAALLVLAARAERGRARFEWGVLQRPDAALFSGVGRETVAPLLAARSALPASAKDLAAWAKRADEAGWEDAWIVGARGAMAGWRRATLEIRDVLDPARRALSVVATSPGAPPREVELELPPDRACTRLIRDPFQVEAQRPAIQKGGPPVSNLVFAANGTKLFARAATGEILAYPVPASPGAPLGRVKRYRPRAGGVVAAVGWVSRGLVMLVVKDREIVLEHTARSAPPMLQRTYPLPERFAIARSELTDPLAPLVYSQGEGGEIHFADARRALFRIGRPRLDEGRTGDAGGSAQDRAGPADVERVADEVSVLGAIGGRLAFVARRLTVFAPVDDPDYVFSLPALAAMGGGFHLVVRAWPGDPDYGQHLEGDGSFEACCGFDEGASRGVVAVQCRRETWSVFGQGASPDEYTVPDDYRVVGPWRTGLVVVKPDERTLSFIGRGLVPNCLPRAAAPIAHAVLNVARPQLAYVTTTGEVVVCSLHDGATLARFLPEAPR